MENWECLTTEIKALVTLVVRENQHTSLPVTSHLDSASLETFPFGLDMPDYDSHDFKFMKDKSCHIVESQLYFEIIG